jgi:hypothetical protein
MKILKWVPVILAFLILLLTIFLAYMGAFSPLTVYKAKMGPFTIAYESFTGPYAQSGPVFARVYEEIKAAGVASAKGLGIYYDDPRKILAKELRSDCGMVVEDKDIAKLKALGNKIKVKKITENLCLFVEFPVRNPLSYMIGPLKAYPALNNYAAANGLRGKMTYELYDDQGRKIIFVLVLEPAKP